MRGFAYAIAAIAAVGIVIAIATMPGQSASETTSAPAAAETLELVETSSTVKTEPGMLTLAVPEMHCEFACFPKVKETLESTAGVELVELAPQKEEGAIDNRQVIVTFKPGFDVNDAIARLSKEGFDDSDVVQ